MSKTELYPPQHASPINEDSSSSSSSDDDSIFNTSQIRRKISGVMDTTVSKTAEATLYLGQKVILAVPQEITQRSMNALAKSSQTGLNYIFNKNWRHKIVWILLLATGILLTVMQCFAQIKQFFDGPISTNIDIEYRQNLTFPAVAICNQNQFRLSIIAKYNGTELIRELSHNTGTLLKNTPGFEAFLDTVGDIDSRYFLTEAAQLRDRLIISCRWPDQSLCTAADFRPIATDMGICFAINTERLRPRLSIQAGLVGAMQLIINAEKYENIERSCALESNTDIFVVVYNQTTVPLVRQSGINIPIGFTTNIAIKTKQRRAIPIERGGTCKKSQYMTYFGQDVNGFTACALDKAFSNVNKVCNCEAYNAPLEHANLSSCSIKQHFDCVIRQFIIPREVQKVCFPACSTTEFETSQTVTTLSERILFSDPTAFMQVHGDRQKRQDNSLKPVTWSCPTSIITQEQSNQIQSTFVQVTELRHRYQTDLAEAIAEPIKAIIAAGERLAELRYVPVVSEFLPTFDRLAQNVSCFANLVQNTNFTGLIGLFNVDGLSEGANNAGILKVVTDSERVQSMDEAELQAEVELLKERDPNYVDLVHTLVSNISKTLSAVWKPFDADFYAKSISGNLTVYMNLFAMLDNYTKERVLLADLANVMYDTEFINFFERDLKEVLYEHVQEDLGKSLIGALVEDEDSPVNKLADMLRNETLLNLVAYMKMVSTDSDDVEHMTDFLNRIYNCSSGELRERSRALLDEFQTAYRNFYDNLERFRNSLKAYIQQFKFDRSFMRENFLAVNIYFHDLSVEKISQDLTYSVWSLMCDIGGTLGLFIGASVLTVIELIWLCTTECLKRRAKRLESRSNSRRPSYSDNAQKTAESARQNRVHPLTVLDLTRLLEAGYLKGAFLTNLKDQAAQNEVRPKKKKRSKRRQPKAASKPETVSKPEIVISTHDNISYLSVS